MTAPRLANHDFLNPTGARRIRVNGYRNVMIRAALIWAVVAVSITSAHAQPFDRLVVFGDSLSDTGNASALTFGLVPDPQQYFAGRFSNGPIWAEVLAETLGLATPAPFLAGGSNYAIGGAEVDTEPDWGMHIQVFLYLILDVPPTSNDLFVLWGGGNDFLNGEMDVEVVVNDFALNLFLLADAGARHFVVPNLPPLGDVPLNRGTSRQQVLNDRVAEYNTILDAALEFIELMRPNVQIYRVDISGTFDMLVADPSAFGIANTTDAALNQETGQVVPDPFGYLFWDSIHPSATGHWWLGQLAAIQLPF